MEDNFSNPDYHRAIPALALSTKQGILKAVLRSCLLKIFVLTFFLLALLTAFTFAQSEIGLLNVYKYAVCFFNDYGRLDNLYARAASGENYNKIAALSGNAAYVDTSLEIVLLSYSAGVIDIRPEDAAEMLPANNQKQADMKLGAAVFQEIQVLKFLGNSAPARRYGEMLKFIINRKNVKRADIKKYFRSNIGALVSDIVDEAFNKTSIHTESTVRRQTRAYGGIITRNPQNGQYTLNYEKPDVQNSRKILTGNSLDALLKILSQNDEFSQSALDTIRFQAGLIPAVALSNNALNEIKTVLTNFCVKPDKSTYQAVLEAYKIIDKALQSTGNPKYAQISGSYQIAVFELSRDIAVKIYSDEKSLNKIRTLSKTQQQRLIELR